MKAIGTGVGARVLLALAAAIACGDAALAARGFTPEFENGATRPRSIALLPVEANITRARVIATEGLLDESVAYGEFYNEQVGKLLSEKGYEVRIVDADRINGDPKLQEYVVDAKRAYDEMMKQYRPKRLPKRIYNAGDSSRLLASYLGVDAIAFSRMNMTITPAGKAIVSALIGGTTAGAAAQICLVDGDTADLEVVQVGAMMVAPGEKTDGELEAYVAMLAKANTKRIPRADPTARIEEGADDDDVLEDVEALLAK